MEHPKFLKIGSRQAMQRELEKAGRARKVAASKLAGTGTLPADDDLDVQGLAMRRYRSTANIKIP